MFFIGRNLVRIKQIYSFYSINSTDVVFAIFQRKVIFTWIELIINLESMKKFALYSSIFSIAVMAIISCSRQKESATGKQGIEDNSWLEEITIAELRQGYAGGKYKVADVVSAYLVRIEEIDNNGPALNSIIIINPDAMAIAENLDRMSAEDRALLPLYGVPVVIKDNIDTHDSMPNTAGATVLRNSFPAADSPVARKLREAGAVIIAKSNLSEWANFRGMTSTSGWSGVGGQTKNPYVLDRNPCGSSSGSGVSVSANLCMVAIGTETNGSIVCPSNNNGIVGLKPTVGLISRTGIIPISFTQDTPGPMGRTVEDVATCLGALTGIDSADSKTLASNGRSFKDYRQFLKKDGLNGKRIGFLKSSGGFSDRVDTLMKNAIAFMKEQGAEIIEVEQPRGSEYDDASFQVLLYEFKDGLNRYFSGLGENAPVKTIAELIEFNKKDPVELRFFDQKILEAANKKGDLNSPEYRQALKKMLS
jgi:amidase